MTQKYTWLPTILLLPSLYVVGWLIVSPTLLLPIRIQQEELSLSGTLVTFLFFVLLLPSWVKIRWKNTDPWDSLGIKNNSRAKGMVNTFFNGLISSCVLILIIFCFIYFGSWIDDWVVLSLGQVVNAIFLGFGVAFAEELLFRSWLWGEIRLHGAVKWGLFLQAFIFSIAHIRFDLEVTHLMTLLMGLFLFGLVLGVRRQLDQGSLWGCIGLHGGLIAIWFLLSQSLKLSDNVPNWLIGPGAPPNPIGGLISMLTLLGILSYHRNVLDRRGRFFTFTDKASSNVAKP